MGNLEVRGIEMICFVGIEIDNRNVFCVYLELFYSF
jgi:hypothetical protein